MANAGFEHLLSHLCRQELPDGRRQPLMRLNERALRRLVTITAALGVVIAAMVVAIVLSSLSSQQQNLRLQQHRVLLQLASANLKDLGSGTDTVRAPVADDLWRALPAWAFREQRNLVVVDTDGLIRSLAGASMPGLDLAEGQKLPETLLQAMRDQPAGKVISVFLPAANASFLAAARPLPNWPGFLVLLQPANAPTLLHVHATALFSGILGLLIILSVLLALYNWQANQAAADNDDHHHFINRLEEALELGRCGLWDWDVGRSRIYLTRSMRKLLGLPEEQGYMDLAEFLQLQHPEEPPIDELLDQQMLTGEETFEQELRLKNQADGTWLWVKLRGALPVQGGHAPHLLGIAIDITAQKRATADKRDAELLLDQAIEAISESFALWDAGMRLVKCNSKFREFHGLPAEACRPGMAYADIMSQAGCRCRKREFRHALDGARGREIVMEMQLEDGRWLQISERQMERGGCVSVGTDITELKRKQLELERSRSELEQMVQALEHSQEEIEHKNEHLRQMARRYQQAKERAERALRTKSQILANVSHELFTPLNHIRMSAEMMLHQALGPLNERYADYVRQVLKAGDEVQRKIRDIMEYAELSTESRTLQYASFKPAELLAEVVEEHAPQAEEKGIALQWRAPDELVAQADAQCLHQALRQLVSNAVTFTEKGEVWVSADVQEENNSLLLSVRDTGIGIPEELLSRIGQPFERAGSAYNSHKGGSGIGLAIARAVAEMHGGHLKIDSTPGKGTLVCLVIPDAVTTAAGAEQDTQESPVRQLRQPAQ